MIQVWPTQISVDMTVRFASRGLVVCVPRGSYAIHVGRIRSIGPISQRNCPLGFR